MTCPLCASNRPPTPIVADSGDYLHCAHCDLVFQSPEQWPTPGAEHAHYLTHDNRVDDPRYRAFLSRLAEPLVARLAPGAVGLDYGAGPGPALAAMLTEAGFPTSVYDPFFSPDSDLLARRYDFITCTEVIEHTHRPAQEFDRLATMLEPGGWLGLMTELRPPLDAFAGWYYHRDPTHVCFFSEASIRWIARRRGWVVDLIEPRVILLRSPAP